MEGVLSDELTTPPEVLEANRRLEDLRPKLPKKLRLRYYELDDQANRLIFDPDRPPERPMPRYWLKGVPICTVGNLTTITAQAQHGKSAFIGAMIAARLAAEIKNPHADLLGLTADGTAQGYLIHADTEQSPVDHHALLCRALKRAGVERRPEWLLSYTLAGKTKTEIREMLAAILYAKSISVPPASPSPQFGFYAVIIDGAADLVEDVNDAIDCNQLVSELHGFAINYRCPIINVVHENPASAKTASGKMRGHLGSQLERKSESNLRIVKRDGVSVVFSDKQRGAPILEADGPRFVYSVEAGMHVSEITQRKERQAKDQAHARELARTYFPDDKPMRRCDLKAAIQKAEHVSESTADNRIAFMRDNGAIEHRTPNMWAKTF